MKKFNTHFCAALLVLMMLAVAFSTGALAAGPIDTEASCTLSVSFRPEDKAAEGVRFSLYRVADVSRGCQFTPTEDFEAYPIVKLLEQPDAESYRLLSATLPGYIAADSIAAFDTSATDAEGTAQFRRLPTGLYLVTGEVYQADRRFYTPEAFLVCLPNRLEDDSWDYDVEVNGKYDFCPDSDPVDVSVVKLWSDSSANTHATDAVVVKLYDGTELYDTQTLSKENGWAYEWKGLYGGTKWTLVETQYPSGYMPRVDRLGNRFIVTNSTTGRTAGGKLPQTGLLWWPVPLLLLGGAVLIALGAARRKRG